METKKSVKSVDTCKEHFRQIHRLKIINTLFGQGLPNFHLVKRAGV